MVAARLVIRLNSIEDRHLAYVTSLQDRLKLLELSYLLRALNEWLNDLEPSFSRTCIKMSSLNSGNVWSATANKQGEDVFVRPGIK